jgi:hypothetical protein
MKLSIRLGIVAAALVFAGCGATKDAGPEELIPDEDATGGDSDNTSGWDIGLDVDPDATGDTSCASTSAAAIKPPVDVIIVIDQSGSMGAESIQVQNNINNLATFLNATKLDYRVIMIAGMPGNGALPMCVPEPLAGPSCASKPPRYRAVNRHIESWDALKWVIQTYDSTDPALKWSDMLRTESTKVFIPITDDNANDSFLTVPRDVAFDDMILARGKGTFGTKTKRKYVFYPICGVTTGDTTYMTKCSTAVNTGSVYVDLATLTKGKPFSVCETDYAPVFKAIGESIATRVACELTIPAAPTGEKLDPNRVNVTYTPGTGGAPTTVVRDESADCFAGANGWQYNADKTKILLCGDACKKVQADLGAKVDVQFGCATITK